LLPYGLSSKPSLASTCGLQALANIPALFAGRSGGTKVATALLSLKLAGSQAQIGLNSRLNVEK